MGALGGLLGTSWALLGISWALGGLLERSSMTFGAIFDAMGAILEASWTVSKPSWGALGALGVQLGVQRSSNESKWALIDLLRRLEHKMAKPQHLNTAPRIVMISEVLWPLLGAQIAEHQVLKLLEERW